MRLLETAFKLVDKIERSGGYGNIELNNVLQKREQGNFDSKLLTEMVYGTVRTGKTLDWILSFYISRPAAKIAPKILLLLRICTYQLFFMRSVKPQLLCSDAVDLAKSYGHEGTAKFVNAVLRSMVRDGNKPAYPLKEENFIRYASLKYCLPEWLVARWQTRYGDDECEALCDFCNQPPHLSIRVNTLKTNRRKLMQELAEYGIDAAEGRLSANAVICRAAVSALEKHDLLSNGTCYIQDEAAMLAVEALKPQKGEVVIDVCAAPGGKSTYIAELMGDEGKVYAFDIHPHKLKLIEENAKKMGISSIKAVLQDATDIPTQYRESADCVLADVPCSGLGVLRRRPDLRWRKQEEEIAKLPFLQKNILLQAAKCLKSGGRLVYSTCTMEEEENEGVIQWFLQKHDNFTLERPLLNVMPHKNKTDGFFIAVLKKESL